jgi:hypothetical protein
VGQRRLGRWRWPTNAPDGGNVLLARADIFLFGCVPNGPQKRHEHESDTGWAKHKNQVRLCAREVQMCQPVSTLG